jgi:predicted nicotinamide N-methyase
MNLAARIAGETVVTAPSLVPELRLHLITHDCRLWHAGEKEAAEAGLPEPYWAFAWPGGQALARHLLDHPHLVRDKCVLDFGSGSAIEGLAALMAGAASVVAADLDPVAAVAAGLNARLNVLEGLETVTCDLIGTTPEAEVVLAGDVFYDRDLARAGRAWLEALHRRGITVLIGDPSRGFLDLGGLVQVGSYRSAADGDTTGRDWKQTGVWTFA